MSGILDMMMHIADENPGPLPTLRPKGFVHEEEREWNDFAETSQWSVVVDSMARGGSFGYSDEYVSNDNEYKELQLEPEHYMILNHLSEPRSTTQVQRHLQAKGILSVKFHFASLKQAENMVTSLVNMGLVEKQGSRFVRKRTV